MGLAQLAAQLKIHPSVTDPQAVKRLAQNLLTTIQEIALTIRGYIIGQKPEEQTRVGKQVTEVANELATEMIKATVDNSNPKITMEEAEILAKTTDLAFELTQNVSLPYQYPSVTVKDHQRMVRQATEKLAGKHIRLPDSFFPS